ncbi:hypothetical protein MRB53_002053 [Persea americana]|uniref:Uncharacterized protein n=1 Tax=Persea americana TaxID=3435 RepID=A0ACC2MTH1_PERAE|nr:hypothetical protein MRB53_002053 [Persea americana]
MKSNTIAGFVKLSRDVFQGPLTNWKKNGVVGSAQGAFMPCQIFQKSGLKNVVIHMAHQLFDEMPRRMLFSRIALISGYVYFYVSVVGANTHIGEVSDDEMIYVDAPTHNQPPIEDEFFIEMDELSNSDDVGASGFEMLDEFLAYFDATNDNLYHVPLDSSSNLSERVDFNSYPLVLRSGKSTPCGPLQPDLWKARILLSFYKSHKNQDSCSSSDHWPFVISDFFAESLKSDVGFLNAGEFKKIGLAAKWCLSLDSSFDRTTLLCESIAKRVFPWNQTRVT